MDGSFSNLTAQLAFLLPATAVAFDLAASIVLMAASRTRRQAVHLAPLTGILGLWSISIALKTSPGFVDDHPGIAQALNFPVLIVPAAALNAVAFLTASNYASGRPLVRSAMLATACLCLMQTQSWVFSGYHRYPGGALASAGPAYPALGIVAAGSLCGAVSLGWRHLSTEENSQLRALRARYCLWTLLLLVPLGVANYVASMGGPLLPLSAIFNILLVLVFIRATMRHGVLLFRRFSVRVSSAGAVLLSMGGLFFALDIVPLGSFLMGASVAPFALLWLGEARILRMLETNSSLLVERERNFSVEPGMHSKRVLRSSSENLGRAAVAALRNLAGVDSFRGAAVYVLLPGNRWLARMGCARRFTGPRRIPIHLLEEAKSRYGWECVEPILHDKKMVGVVVCTLPWGLRGIASDPSPLSWMELVAKDVTRAFQTAFEDRSAEAAGTVDTESSVDTNPRMATRPELSVQARFGGMIGESPAFKQCLSSIEAASRHDQPVLIIGETGTGKELIARATHLCSTRATRPYVVVNCPAIPDELAEVELFGCLRGAYTGASESREGRFELAQGGTIFLDEVADLSPRIQTKLLRVLETHEVQRIGSGSAISVDFRVIAATNRDLEEAVRLGSFRADLYYRLAGFDIQVPSLRARGFVDISQLAFFFYERACGRMNIVGAGIEEHLLEILCSYSWPGNVRELERAIDRAVALALSDPMRSVHLPKPIVTGSGARFHEPSALRLAPSKNEAPESLRSSIRNEKSRLLHEALVAAGGNQAAAARTLGMSRSNLSRMLKRLGIRSERTRT